MPLLAADDLYRFYHPGDAEVRALRGASLTVEPGETVALLGPSGSGKSTLLACLAGLDEPDGGLVTIAGARMTRRPEAERAALRARKVGILAQSRNLFDHLTVAQNVALRMNLKGSARTDVTIGALLGKVDLAHRADALPATLSGGERARAGLAVALATDPPLLLADEPTAEVDAETESRILELLDERRAAGGAALIATHSSALTRWATRVLEIEDGRIAAGPPPQAASRPVPAAPSRAWAAGTGAAEGSGDLLIELSDVSRCFAIGSQRVAVLAGISCRIHAGDRIALVGPSGSGKSTLLDILAALQRPDGGAASWPGLHQDHPLRPRQIGVVFQAPSLLPALSAIENVRLALDIAGLDPASAMEPIVALDRLGLGDLADKLPDQLSGGQMQRVALARALVTRPKVLLADEPTGQLDRETGRRVFDALLAALEGTGTALVVATHDATIAARLERSWLMQAGRMTDAATREQAA